MLGTDLQFGRGHGEDLFYNPVRARRSRHHHQQHYQQGPEKSRNSAAAGYSPAPPPAPNDKAMVVVPEFREPEKRARLEEEPSKPVASHASSPAAAAITSPCNLHRFLESTTPSVPAQYLSKMRMRGWRTCDVEFRPYFALGDLWESFKEWSAYGAGVPLVLNGSDSVVQYYVPYLSGIQLYGESSTPSINSRRAGEESDGDYYRDSSSDGSSDYEHEKGLKYSRAWSPNHLTSTSNLRMDRLSLKEKHVASQEGFSSDDGDSGNSQGRLLFEFLEQDPPYIREPLADKVSVLARCFPELKTLRSCDLLPSSWISVAWYPIYRIPTGPTLRDLDACFLTFHYLSTPVRGAGSAPGPVITYPRGVEGVPKISLPIFGLASYKFKSTIWTPSGGERQLVNSLLQAADDWLRQYHVDHPDYRFFASHGVCRR
ncbi:uncharacterized protein LOC103720972 [Phoenix dactylifera]|uniref:Uncharacterized protein LOC103720972 n=1 Tax=Phoenix dactylifera TaxID=42345 RepID=A0A8B9AG20_PHODC|nr:uncharacterized protein LOC103720972 [Phoenix dactylifera]